VLDIHDGLVQDLFAASAQVHSLRQALEREEVDARTLARGLQQVAFLLEHALQEIRAFVHAFGPQALHRRDVKTMVEELVEQRRRLTGMDIRVAISPRLPSPSPPVKVAMYRILQEALANAYRHAAATAVQVRVARQDAWLVMEIVDNGRGFDPEAALQAPRTDKGLGLRGMQERVQALGGTLTIRSAAGEGTCIRVALPCCEGEEADEQAGEVVPETHSRGAGR